MAEARTRERGPLPPGGVEVGACLSQVAAPGLTPAPGMSPDPLLPTWLVHSGRALGQPGDGWAGAAGWPFAQLVQGTASLSVGSVQGLPLPEADPGHPCESACIRVVGPGVRVPAASAGGPVRPGLGCSVPWGVFRERRP